MTDARQAEKRPRILLADDHPLIVNATRRLLLAMNYEVVGAVADGEQLLKAVEELQPDLVIADLNLPKGGGLGACQQIRQTHPNIKVILFTAGTVAGLTETARARGAAALVMKQGAGEELLAAIKAACDD